MTIALPPVAYLKAHLTIQRSTRWILIVAGMIFTALIGLARPALAQSSAARVLVNYGETADANGGLGLNLYFTLVDSNERVLPAQSFHTGSIVLDDGSPYTVQVAPPTSPLYVVLALDVGGSMTGSDAQMLQAAAQLVNNSPTQARFALITFEQTLKTLVDFSANADRGTVLNAINSIKVPRVTQGTCLYDAVVNALTMLGKVPAGRRALVLFTDGLDIKLNGGGPCSKSTYNDVIALATNQALRIPIHTIALQGNTNQPPNVYELQNMAVSTGGLWETGTKDQLVALFGQIASELSQQLVASAVVYPKQGSHAVTFFVTLNDNTPARPDGTKITAGRDYPRPASAQATAGASGTAVPGTIGITSIQADTSAHVLTIQLQLQGSIPATEYHFLLKNAETNLLIGEYTFSPPLQNPIKLPVDTLTSGQYSLTVNAIGADGLIVARSPDTADDRFAYILPTATPTATPTDTPTNNPTATITPTSTPITVSLGMTIQADPATNELVVNIQADNTSLISHYRLEFVNTETNLVTNTLTYNTPPYDLLRVPLSQITSGKYSLTLTALDANNQPLAHTQLNISYNPPTITPTLEATLTPTAAPSPTPVPFGTAEWLRQNTGIVVPIGLIVVLVLLIGLLGVIFSIRSRRRTDYSGHLNPLTGVIPLPNAANAMGTNPPGSLNPTPAVPYQDPSLTNVTPYQDPSLTNVIPQAVIPGNKLTIQQSLDQGIVGQIDSIGHSPFVIGRTSDDLKIPNDKNVSRRHAQIVFENGDFYIEDLNSQLGTTVKTRNGLQNVPRGGRVPLESGALIVLGTSTALLFTFETNPSIIDPGSTAHPA